MAQVVGSGAVAPAEAEAAGFARFNGGPHLLVEVPDGNFTITARTSDGRRLTVAFLPERQGGPASSADVVYHDRGSVRTNGRLTLPTFDQFTSGPKGRPLSDSRKLPGPEKPGIVTVMMDKVEPEPAAAPGVRARAGRR